MKYQRHLQKHIEMTENHIVSESVTRYPNRKRVACYLFEFRVLTFFISALFILRTIILLNFLFKAMAGLLSICLTHSHCECGSPQRCMFDACVYVINGQSIYLDLSQVRCHACVTKFVCQSLRLRALGKKITEYQ